MIGIGASAGGLAALEKFFAHFPLNSQMACVVIQHTRPLHKTWLGTLLQRVTTLPICDANDGTTLMPNTVYVMPTDGEMTLAHGRLHFVPVTAPHPTRLPIDVFLTSLAQDQSKRAVGVILSGMGQDGTLGLTAIHKSGGLCLAQLPSSAEFPSMPQNAIDAGCVTEIAEPEDLPNCIVQWANGRASRTEADLTSPAKTTDWLQSIVGLLQQKVKHDFSLYKPKTLQRRVERRMQVHQLSSMADYALHLRNNPQELTLLFAEILIGVTRFFRDSQVWSDLKELALPDLLKSANKGGIRAWVLGCSTGEEAYTLAMTLQEAQEDLARSDPAMVIRPVKIFATDLNAAAIAIARKGWYSASALTGISSSRKDRFFTPHQGGYSVLPSLRAMLLFAPHDVIADPPFTQLDILSCRNLLIYFNSALQRRLMPLFHFSLRPGGLLVLGSAETVGRAQSLFSTLNSPSRIYRRQEKNGAAAAVDFLVHRPSPTRSALQELPMPHHLHHAPPNLQTMADQLMLQKFSPAAVLVNVDGDIVYIHGRTRLYLEPAAGKANWNVHVMLRKAWRSRVSAALRKALHERHAVVLKGLPLDDDFSGHLQLTIHPLHEPKALAGMAMLVFQETPSAPTAGPSVLANQGAASAELLTAQEELQALRSEMLATKEEMQGLNESLQTANEELQSSNEELTTSQEEEQSMNEELQTINGELQTRLDDLALAQSDMQNLLNSTDIATLFLDNDLNVRRYTEQAVGIFHLRESDVGRPLSDLASTLSYPDLQEDVKETLRTLIPCAKSAVSTDGRWYSVRIMPYRTLSNLVQGAVITFVDISAAKALEFQLREAHRPSPHPESST